MTGTRAGGLKAAQKNLTRDPEFYRVIGSEGGRNGNTGGFHDNPDLARIAGAKGGRVSRPSLTVDYKTTLETYLSSRNTSECAAALGITRKALYARIHAMRRAGVNIPHRRSDTSPVGRDSVRFDVKGLNAIIKKQAPKHRQKWL